MIPGSLDASGYEMCYMEGCIGNGHCPRCGKVNYALLGYYGAVARWAKVWGISRWAAEDLIKLHKKKLKLGTRP